MSKAELINNETKKVFDKLFTINDILKGDSISMNKEARKIAIKNLKEAKKI